MVIGILMLLGLGLNRGQLQTLSSNTVVEEFRGDFDHLFMSVLNSNVAAGGKNVSAVKVVFDTEKNQVRSQLVYRSE